MTNVLIVGARADGHAKVVLEILLAQGLYNVVGFIDDDVEKKGGNIRGFRVLGTMRELSQIKNELKVEGFIVAIGNNAQRRELSRQCEALGMEAVNAIHPTSHIDSDVITGNGNFIGQGAIIVTGSRLGNCVNIHTGATIDHDNLIEDGANLGPGVHTAGRVIIRRDAFLGTGSSIIPDVCIGEGAIVGAGSVVIGNVGAYKKVVGVPAKEITGIDQTNDVY